MTRLGLLGGTFDPIHFGHLVIAEEARARLDLAEVRFIPTGQPPHKGDWPVTPAVDRLAMVRRAVAGNPAFTVSAMEIERGGPSYTVDTLHALRRQEGADCALYFIVGGDGLRDLLAWRDPAGILELCTLVVVRRPGIVPLDLPVLQAQLPTLREKLILLDGPLFDVSGTELRARAGAGLPIRYQVPDAVLAYIEDYDLYHPAPTC